MDSSGKKRKFTEIDENTLVNSASTPNSIVKHEDYDQIRAKISLKVSKPIIPSDGNENNIQNRSEDDSKNESNKTYNENMYSHNIRKKERRTHFKSCDRSKKKVSLVNDGTQLNIIQIPLDVIQRTPLERPSVPECGESENQQSGLHTYAWENDSDANEIKLWFSCDYIEDILTYEFEKEKRYKLSDEFCRKYDVDPVRREILIEWLICVQIHLKAGNNTLYLAVSLLDILLDRIHIPYHLLQVSAVAAFWVAYKVTHGSLSVKTLIGLCAGIPTRNTILEHEILVLETSRLLESSGGELSIFFNYIVFKLFGSRFPPEIYYCGQYFLEIMLLQFLFIDCAAHEKAITAVYAALYVFESPLSTELFSYTRFITRSKLRLMNYHLMRFVRIMYSKEYELKNSGLFTKYKSSRYFRISTHGVLKNLR